MMIADTDRDCARVLWDYHHMDEVKRLSRYDFILALGSHDVRVAERAADLYLEGLSDVLVTSGGFGKVTRDIWGTSEGEHFANIAIARGVPSRSIVVESEATNTGANIVLARQALAAHGLRVVSGLLVCKPYMRRRAYATAAKQWPEVIWGVDSPTMSFEEYPDAEVPEERMINLMVGDLQRIRVYAEDGFQIFQEIPSLVWEAYEALRDRGFDKFVMADR